MDHNLLLTGKYHTMKVAVAILLLLVRGEFSVAHNEQEFYSNVRSGRRQLGKDSQVISRCEMRDPNPRDNAARKRAIAFARFRRERKAGVDAEASTYIVPVCFHNPRWANPVREMLQNRLISDERIQEQLDHMNKAYSMASCCDTVNTDWCTGNCSVDTSIQFVLAKIDDNGTINGTTTSVSDPNACIKRPRVRCNMMSMGPGNDRPKKRLLRVGDESVLNVYFVKIKSLVGQTLGYATFPWDYDNDPDRDGVVIDYQFAIGNNNDRFGEGDTLVHEVG